MKILYIFLVAMFFFSGCAPKYKVKSPSISARVLDAKTGKPIRDVIVSGSVNTDKNGYFLIPKKSELGIGTVMGGVYRISREINLVKNGYIPVTCVCDVLVTKAMCEDEIIYMKKVRKDKKFHILHIDSHRYGFHCFLGMDEVKITRPVKKDFLFQERLTQNTKAQIKKFLSGYKDIKNITIIGHTNQKGTDGYNLSLSLLKADKTKKFLVDELGYKEDTVHTNGYGEDKNQFGKAKDRITLILEEQ